MSRPPLPPYALGLPGVVDRVIDAGGQRIARRVAKTTDEELSRMLRPRMREPLARFLFTLAPLRFDRDRAGRRSGVVDFVVDDQDRRSPVTYQVAVRDGKAKITRGGTADASARVVLTTPALVRLVSGAATAPELYVKGTLRIEGNIMSTVVMSALFRFPKR